MEQPRQKPTTDDLQQAMREYCLEQAEFAHQRIGEVAQSLREGNHLRALGALEGTEKRVLELSVALKLIHDLWYRRKT